MRAALTVLRQAVLIASTSILLMAAAGAQAPPGGAASTAPGAAPKVEIPQPVYDFGTVLEGQPVAHSFRIRNAGGADLVIDHLQTTCGCTAAEPSKKRLKPGEETAVAVTFDTRFQKGRRERTVTAFTNDPKTPRAEMSLQGEVKVEVEARPAEVSFDKIRHGTEDSRAVEVAWLGKGANFRVGKVSNSSPYIKVTETALKDGKPGAMLRVTLLKSMPLGPFDDTIEVATNHQPVQVHVFGRVVGVLALEPAQISFGIVPHGQGVVRILRLTNSGAKTIQVTGISSTNQSVAAKVEPVAAGRVYKITVELRRGTPDGQLRGTLAIRTDYPEQSTLTVPFYGIVGAFQG